MSPPRGSPSDGLHGAPPDSDRAHRFPEAGGGSFSTTHDILRCGLMLANDGELDGRCYLAQASMQELRLEQTSTTKVNCSLGYLCGVAERYRKLAEGMKTSGSEKFSWIYNREIRLAALG